MSTTVEEIEKTEVSQDKKDELLLNSLEIKGYRCFEHLTIENLGRVNLIVGKNNVGKTALLEALWIYANKESQLALYSSLSNRDEFPSSEQTSSFRALQQISRESLPSVKNLFYGRPSLAYSSPDAVFTIGELGVSTKIKEKITNDLTIEYDTDRNLVKVEGIAITSPDSSPSLKLRASKTISNFSSYFIGTEMLKNADLVNMWDEVEQKVLEDSVIESLRIIDEDLIDIRFSGYANKANYRVPVARLKNVGERVPLKSLGEGMSHILGISLALVKCKDGMLLIDEIESGFHYSVLPDVWKLIFKTAKDLNVQVFATTHSKDCIEAFTQAAIDDEESDGMLIQLIRQGEKIVARTIEEEMLADAVDYNVEVR